MRIVIITSYDYQNYTLEAEYRDGTWTGNLYYIELAQSIANEYNLDLNTIKGAQALQVAIGGSITWAKIVPDDWKLKNQTQRSIQKTKKRI